MTIQETVGWSGTHATCSRTRTSWGVTHHQMAGGGGPLGFVWGPAKASLVWEQETQLRGRTDIPRHTILSPAPTQMDLETLQKDKYFMVPCLQSP